MRFSGKFLGLLKGCSHVRQTPEVSVNSGGCLIEMFAKAIKMV